MGRIKTTMVKKAAKKSLEEYGDQLNEDFEHNKEILKKISDANKKIRNKIAGQIVRSKKQNK